MSITYLDGNTEPARFASAIKALETCMAAGLVLLLMFAVLAFGATQGWSTFVLEAGSAALFVLWALRQGLKGSVIVSAGPLLAAMAVFGALITAQAFAGLSAYAFASRMEWMRYASYAMIFLVAQSLFRHNRWRERIAIAFAVFGFAVAVLGVAQDMTAGGRIYWRIPVPASGAIYGPYTYHGAYAGLMELLAPLALALAFDRWRHPAQRLLFAFAGVVMGATVFLSRSRGGMIAFVCELFLFMVLLATHGRSSRSLWKIAGVAVAAAVLVATLGTSQIAQQIRSLRSPFDPKVNGDRITIARDAVRMFRDRPLAGWGLDVFPVAYPHYRSFATVYFINEAHNDYAQLLVETGAIGFLAMLAFVFLLYRGGLRNMREQDASARMLTLAALTGCAGMLVHSLGDFNFHIPANAALFLVLCALAAVPPVRARRDRDQRLSSEIRAPFVDAASSLLN